MIPCDKQSKTIEQVLTCYCKVSATELNYYNSLQSYYRHRTPGKWYTAIPIHYITKCDKSSFNLPVIDCPTIINYSFQSLSQPHQPHRHHHTDVHKFKRNLLFTSETTKQNKINKNRNITGEAIDPDRPYRLLQTAISRHHGPPWNLNIWNDSYYR